MKKAIQLSLIFCTIILCGSWTNKTAKVPFSDVTVSFGNGTYYNATVTVSNSSGYYSSVTANPHSYASLYVPQGTYNVRVEVAAPYDTPYHTYNYNFYCGSASKYGSTLAYFENVVVDYSLSVIVN
ncbi:hypothetical protein [Pedobacter panaciterrae]|jgi:hypothetical protein|uniref:GOLD domain-containing protein n=1 Tax=Pedobacter panaciterrae TaxID=363849 RepID=A0ABU8NJP8_9SPHI|nr:hypothetical protein [Pedobacter panaciterrae]NQX56088.1 hypothetical protein [Pedobacter panaciterrae]